MTMNVVEISGMEVCMMTVQPLGGMPTVSVEGDVHRMTIPPVKKIDPEVVASFFQDEARSKAAYVVATFSVRQDIEKGILWHELVDEIRNHAPDKVGSIRDGVSRLAHGGFLDVPVWKGDIRDVLRNISKGEPTVVYPTEKFFALVSCQA